MRDARSLTGRWVRDSHGFAHQGDDDKTVYVRGDTKATADRSTWTMWAVMEVKPHGVPFLAGWSTRQSLIPEFWSEPVETVDGLTHLSLIVVALTLEDDPRFADMPSY
jgi:hypothetical protein